MKTSQILTVFLLLLAPAIFACQAVTQVLPTETSPAVPLIVTQSTPSSIIAQSPQIQLSDNGKTFTYRITDRFSVFLDDARHPVANLSCSPDGIIGYVSNGSMRGPNQYPIMFEAVAAGQCMLKDGDFSATIEVVGP